MPTQSIQQPIYATYNKFLLGERLARTVTIGGMNTTDHTQTVIVQGENYLDPATNPTVLDLNGGTTNPINLYAIKNGSLSVAFKETKLFTSTSRSKHGAKYVDFQFQDRLIQFILLVNIRPYLLPSSPIGAADGLVTAKQAVQKLLKTAASFARSEDSHAGSGSIEGRGVVLMIQLNASSKPVYFEVLDGEVDPQDTYAGYGEGAGLVEVKVTIKARYAAKGDKVYLQNAIANGNFVTDQTNRAMSYWNFIGDSLNSSNSTFITYDSRNIKGFAPPIYGNNQPTALEITPYANNGNFTVYSQWFTVPANEQFILDFWYAANPKVTTGTPGNFFAYVQYTNVSSDIDNTVPSGATTKLAYITPNLDLTTASPGNNTTTAAGQFVGNRYTSPIITINSTDQAGTYTNSSNNLGVVMVRVVFEWDTPSLFLTTHVFLNQVALWRFPPYADPRLVHAPSTEYVNVIPALDSEKLTTIYGIRGDIECPFEMQIEPHYPTGSGQTNPLVQAISIGMRVRQGQALPKYIKFGNVTQHTSALPDTTYGQWSASDIAPNGSGGYYSFQADNLSRQYKVIAEITASDNVAFAIRIGDTHLSGRSIYTFASGYFTGLILPNSRRFYLPGTGSYTQVGIDCGVVGIPSDDAGNAPTNVASVSPSLNIIALFNGIQGLSTQPTQTSSIYGLILLPADQYIYIDTRHTPNLTNTLSDGTPGITINYPIRISTVSEQVVLTVSDFNAIHYVNKISALFSDNPMRFQPAARNGWRSGSTDYPLTAVDTQPMEIAAYPRLTDSNEPDFIKKSGTQYAETDLRYTFVYEPFYADINGSD